MAGVRNAWERAEASNTGVSAASFLSNAGLSFRRGEFFADLFVLGFSNGIFERITGAIAQGTVSGAILSTFGISVLVWVACWSAVSLLVRQPAEPVTRNDVVVLFAVAAAGLVPSAPASWIAVTGLGLYGLHCFKPGSPGRRAAFVILAVTVPMFWSRLVFAMLSDLILQADAILVSWIAGTDRVGNTIRFADDWGYLFIGPPCSSLANVSLAVLGWVLFTQALARRPSLMDVCWGLAACSAVVAINVTRIALIALHRESFELLHGWAGASVASFLTLAAIVGINMIGIRGDIVARS